MGNICHWIRREFKLGSITYHCTICDVSHTAYPWEHLLVLDGDGNMIGVKCVKGDEKQ